MSETEHYDTGRGIDEDWKRDIAIVVVVGYVMSAGFYASGWTPLTGAAVAPVVGVVTYILGELWLAGRGDNA